LLFLVGDTDYFIYLTTEGTESHGEITEFFRQDSPWCACPWTGNPCDPWWNNNGRL